MELLTILVGTYLHISLEVPGRRGDFVFADKDMRFLGEFFVNFAPQDLHFRNFQSAFSAQSLVVVYYFLYQIGTVSRGYFERSYNFERCSMCPYNRV